MAALGARLEGARVLDLFAGSGALGLEALSRGAANVTFVESDGAALRVLAENVALLGAGGLVRVVRRDALRYVSRLEPLAFDIALADPPYERGLAARLITAYLAHPFAHELWVEHRASEPVPGGARTSQRRYGDTILTFVTARE